VCLIIHKPAGATIEDALLASATGYNPHGMGIMARGANGELTVWRRSRTDLAGLRRTLSELTEAECVVHLRYRTRGDVDSGNTHPLRVTRNIWLAHNGTLRIDCHRAGRSDSWHLARDYLGPILRRRPAALHEIAFQKLVAAWLGPSNKAVFMDAAGAPTVIINRDRGATVGPLWISNTRWFDGSRFPWYPARARRVPRRDVQFSV